MTPQSQLPEVPATLSALIRAAIAEARRLDPSVYQPNHEFWHAPCPAACFVCDAGAVIAGLLIPASDDLSPTSTVYPEELPREWHDALLALDFARSGRLHEALASFFQAHDPGAPFDPAPFHTVDRTVFRFLGPNVYSDYTNWTAFHAHLDYMEQVASQLEMREL